MTRRDSIRTSLTAGLAAGLATVSAYAQEPAAPVAAPKAPPANTEPLVYEWLKRLNALADWPVDPKANPPKAAIDKFVELYAPGAFFFVGPNEDQIGSVLYSGASAIATYAERFARTYSKSEFRIQVQTVSMQTTALMHVGLPPWGGFAVAAEIASYVFMRENKRRFAMPGALFNQYGDDGKIHRTRLYMLSDEKTEIYT